MSMNTHTHTHTHQENAWQSSYMYMYKNDAYIHESYSMITICAMNVLPIDNQ